MAAWMAPRRGYSLPPTANLVNGFGQMQGRRMGVNAISRDSLLNLGTPRDPVPPPKAAKDGDPWWFRMGFAVPLTQADSEAWTLPPWQAE